MQVPLPFTKMSGAGNDFIVIDHRHLSMNSEQKRLLTTNVCKRRFSVGADGIIFIENSETSDFRWDFYNSDGSVAEMCGNGARCAARFAVEKGIAQEKMVFETLAGNIHAEVFGDGSVRIGMTEPHGFKQCTPIHLGDNEKKVYFINTGVPHAIVMVESNTAPVDEWGPIVRYHQQFQPAGTNVNFVSFDGDKIHCRTYERGVEEETRACGTGAVAAALYLVLIGKAKTPVEVVTSGGEELVISFDLEPAGPAANNVTMQGPARIVYEGQLTAETIG